MLLTTCGLLFCALLGQNWTTPKLNLKFNKLILNSHVGLNDEEQQRELYRRIKMGYLLWNYGN